MTGDTAPDMTVHQLAERIRAVRDALRRIPTPVLRDQAIVEWASERAHELDGIANALTKSLDARNREVRAGAGFSGSVVVDGRRVTAETLFRQRALLETASL